MPATAQCRSPHELDEVVPHELDEVVPEELAHDILTQNTLNKGQPASGATFLH